MSESKLALARVLAGVAWADGQLRVEEQDLLFRVCARFGLSAAERREVSALLERPVSIDRFEDLVREYQTKNPSPAERAELLDQVRRMIVGKEEGSPERRYLALLESCLAAGPSPESAPAFPAGAGSAAAETVFPGLRGILGGLGVKSVGRSFWIGPLARSLGQSLLGRAGARAGDRLSDERRYFLTLYGALLYRVVRADGVIRPEETERLRHLLEDGFGFIGAEIEPVVALIEHEIAREADRQHLCAEFNRNADMDERLALLDALFAVGLADGELSPAEEQEIRLIANYLWIETQEYVRVRLRALGEDRPRREAS
jgi:uncharacterized tellurite resistance protein B-like protein